MWNYNDDKEFGREKGTIHKVCKWRVLKTKQEKEDVRNRIKLKRMKRMKARWKIFTPQFCYELDAMQDQFLSEVKLVWI